MLCLHSVSLNKGPFMWIKSWVGGGIYRKFGRQLQITFLNKVLKFLLLRVGKDNKLSTQYYQAGFLVMAENTRRQILQ